VKSTRRWALELDNSQSPTSINYFLGRKEWESMNLNLRNAIVHNVAGNSQDELRDTIVDAIQNGEEKMLPGLGVLFEIIWNNSTEEEKAEMLQALEQGLK
jgi:small acid-soluble spore protein I (minor)